MAEEPPQSRHVAFAERFAAGPVNRFNAYAALERARLLRRETQQIVEIFQREDNQEEPEPWASPGSRSCHTRWLHSSPALSGMRVRG